MTGWPTHVSGHRSLWSLVRDYEPNVLRNLEEAGYDVQWYGKNDNMDNNSIAHSTDYRTAGSGSKYGENPFEMEDPRYYSFLWTPLDESTINTTSDAINVESAISFLEGRAAGAKSAEERGEALDQDPFMIFLPLSYPHPPYSCPEPYYSMVDPANITLRRPVTDANAGKPDYHAGIRNYTGQDQLNATEADVLYRDIMATYLGCMAYSDMLLGRLLDALDDLGLTDDTAVFHFSDHGDYAGDYGLVEKWPSGLEDALTHDVQVGNNANGVANANPFLVMAHYIRRRR